jgi:NitT/TauT family transport system permease protein
MKSSRATPRKRAADGARLGLTRAAVLLALLAGWEAGARTGVIDPFFMSLPTRLADTIAGWFLGGFIYIHIWATVQEALLGLLVGILGGVVVGVLFAFSPFLSDVFQPLMVVLNAMPRIALAPLFIVWLGIGLASKVAMVVSLVFFIVFFSTYAGLRDVDVNLVNHVRVMGGSRGDLMRHVLLPSALTWIFASLRTCVGFAVIGAILGEYLGADRGIGWIVQYGESMFDSNMVLSGLLVLMMFVAVLDASLGWLERRFSHWKQKAL